MPQHEQTTITVTITGTEEGDVEEALNPMERTLEVDFRKRREASQ
jgi:hypothetical protein